jgi:hypothetical protein
MQPRGFWSYARDDDAHLDRQLSALRERLSGEVSMLLGADVSMFQDVHDLRTGEQWAERLRDELSSATFLAAVLTPRYFNSDWCREELLAYLRISEEKGVAPLVFPILLVPDATPGAGGELREAMSPFQFKDMTAWRFANADARKRLEHELADDIVTQLGRRNATAGGGGDGAARRIFRPRRWLLPAGATAVAAAAAAVAWFTLLPPGPVTCAPGQVGFRGTCVDEQWMTGYKEMAAQLSDLVVDINRTMDIKASTLFPMLDRFESSPSPELWAQIVDVAKRLFENVRAGIDHARQYDDRIIDLGNEVTYIATQGAVDIGKQYSNLFSKSEEHWNGRSTIVRTITTTEAMPTPEQVREWRDNLQKMHDELRVELEKIVAIVKQGDITT